MTSRTPSMSAVKARPSLGFEIECSPTSPPDPSRSSPVGLFAERPREASTIVAERGQSHWGDGGAKLPVSPESLPLPLQESDGDKAQAQQGGGVGFGFGV